MFVDGMAGDLPSVGPVTEIALRTVFPAMEIGVAVLAVAAYIRKDWIDVALLAYHSGVHAAQRVSGFAVIKFGLVADRPPGRSGMAVFTRDFQRAVRAAC